MMRTIQLTVMYLSIVIAAAGPVEAGIVTTYYGDDDGFGVGQTSGTLTYPERSHASTGEAPFTDIPLIGVSVPGNPAFAPTGGFDPFFIPLGETITRATLTMRAGAWVSGPSSVSGANRLVLDGLGISTTFFSEFTNTGSLIETRSLLLDASFFPRLEDGNVSLGGTLLSENGGAGQFQIDFLRLDIETVPEPSSIALFALGGLGIALGAVWRWRQGPSAPAA